MLYDSASRRTYAFESVFTLYHGSGISVEICSAGRGRGMLVGRAGR